jgi:hypothetical protein
MGREPLETRGALRTVDAGAQGDAHEEGLLACALMLRRAGRPRKMADDRYGYWIADQSPYRSAPSTASALVLFAVVALVLLTLLSGPQATAQSDRADVPVERREGGSFCDLHRGQPAWDAICAEARRR